MIKSIHVGHFYEYVVSFYATYMQESEISSLGSTITLRHHWCSWLAMPWGVIQAASLEQGPTVRQRFHELQMTRYDKNHTIIQFYKHVVSFHAMCLKI